MIILASTLVLLLDAQDAAPAATATPESCELTDNACKARLFIAKAAKAPPAERAVYLFTAHRSYVALFARTGEARHLCAARLNFERSIAVAGLSAQQRASFEKARGGLEALEHQHSVQCETPRKRVRGQPARVSRAPLPASAETEVPVALLGPEVEPPAPVGLLEVPADRGQARPVAAEPVRGTPRAELTPRPPVYGRPLVIAGGTTLGVGLALMGVAGYAGGRAASVSRSAFEDYQQGHGRGDADALAAQNALRREYDRWLPVAVSTAVVGTTAVLIGAVLTRVGVRRMRQGPARTALVPVPGGLAIHARF